MPKRATFTWEELKVPNGNWEWMVSLNIGSHLVSQMCGLTLFCMFLMFAVLICSESSWIGKDQCSFPMFSHQNSTIQLQMDSRPPLPLDPPDCVFSSLGSRNSGANMQKRQRAVKIRVIDVGVRYPPEWSKTLTMLLYAGCSWLICSSLILVSNKRAPAKQATSPTTAFPSIFIQDVNWVSEISKITSFLLVALWLLQWFLLRYRSIVGRRFLFIIGTLHLYRSLIIYVMVLPIPSYDRTSEEKIYGDWKLLLKQTLKIASTDGLFQQSSVFCGIFMYGHASNLILTYLFIKAYSPGKFWVYHVLCCSICVTGLVSAILLHAYNLLDLVISYFMTTRLFWWYHTLANHQWLKKPSPPNYLSSTWWFRIFVFCEENVLGTLPHSYSWPISCSVRQEKKQTQPKPNLYESRFSEA